MENEKNTYSSQAPVPPAPPVSGQCADGGASAAFLGEMPSAEDARQAQLSAWRMGRRGGAVADGNGKPARKAPVVAIAGALVVLLTLFAVAFAAFGPHGQLSGVFAADEQVAQGGQGTGGASAAKGASEEDIRDAHQAFAASMDLLAANEGGIMEKHVQDFLDACDAANDEGESYGFTQLGITAQDVLPLLLDDFACQVTDVDVYGGVAWIHADITSKSIADAAAAMMESQDAKQLALDTAEDAETQAREQIQASKGKDAPGAASKAASKQKAVVGVAPKKVDAHVEAEQAYKDCIRVQFLDALEHAKPHATSVLLTVECQEDSWEPDASQIENLLGTAWSATV